MPGLSVAALKKQVEGRQLASVYLLVGEDMKLSGRLADSLESVVDPADRAFAVERVYAGESSGTPDAIAGSARTLPMLGDRRIVVVLRAERLLKPKRGRKGGSAEDGPDGDGDSGPVDAGPLEAYLENPVPSTTLVFVASEVDRTRRLTKRLFAAAAVVECGGFGAVGRGAGSDEAAGWLRDELARAGTTIDRDAARLLLDRCGRNITKLRGDVERLLLYVEARGRITSDDVMEVVSTAPVVDDDWAVVNAIAAGDATRALDATGQRIERGDSPHALLGQLRWWVSTRLAPVEPRRVRSALEALLRTDLALKSSGGDDRVLLERLVVELTGRPLPAQRGWRGRR